MSKMRIVGICLFCFIIGFVLVTLAKNTNSEHAFVSATTISDNEVTISAEKEEMNTLKNSIAEAKVKLNSYNEEIVSEDDILNQTEENYYNALEVAGFTQMEGEGVTIFLDDGVRDLREGEDVNSIIVHDMDLMIIINELIGAGAEAISINGERIIPYTEVSCSGHTVSINSRTHARPFYINAIGDKSTLYAAMTIKGGYADILKSYGILFEVERSDNVVIPAYKGNLVIDYMVVEEE